MAPIEELALLDLDRSNKGASKQRRDQINAEIARMRDLLPLPESSRQRLSQLQIMSLTCVFIRKCNTLHKLFRNKSQDQLPDSLDFFQALTGFLLVTTREGKLLYISENVTDYLGHSMVDMKTQGDSLYDIVDKRDHSTVKGQLLQAGQSSTGSGSGASHPEGKEGNPEISFFCRMNMSRTLKRQSGFGDVKVMHVRGHFVNASKTHDTSGCLAETQGIFMATCSPLITPDIKENLIQSNTMVFKTAHKLDMTFVEATKTAEYHLGYSSEELSTKSWYSLLHPEDIHDAKEKHIQLIRSNHEMGCMLTVRMLKQDGTIFWVNTVMHVRQSSFGESDDAYIVCIHQVVNAQEAYQIKMQGHLFTMYPSRAHEIWGNHLTAVAVGNQDHSGPHTWIQQDGTNAVPVPGYQTNLPSYISQIGRPPMYSLGSSMYSPSIVSRQSPEIEQYAAASLVQSDQLKAMLKRKIQGPTQGVTCKPAKIAKFSMNGSNGGVGYSPNMDHGMSYADSFGHAQLIASDIECGGQAVHILQPCVYRIGKHSPIACNGLMTKAAANAINSEQVVPNVNVPDSFLTPDPSPANSPRPNYTTVMVNSPQQGFVQIKSEVIDPEDNVVQEKSAVNIIQALENLVARPQKPTVVQKPIVLTKQEQACTPPLRKRRELPIFDAFDIDNFFETLDPLDDETKAPIKVEAVPFKQEIKVEVTEEDQVPATCIPDFSALNETKVENHDRSPGCSSPQMSPRSTSANSAPDSALLASSQEAPAFTINACMDSDVAARSPAQIASSHSIQDCVSSSTMAYSPTSSASPHESIDDLLSYFSDDGVVSPLQIESDNCSPMFEASSPKERMSDGLESSFEKSFFVDSHCSIPFKMESQRRPEELSPGSSICSLAGEDDWMDSDQSTTLSMNIALDVMDGQSSDGQESSSFSTRDRQLDFILDTLLPSQDSLKMIKHGQ